MKRNNDRLIIYFLGYAYAFLMLLLLATVIYRDIPILTLVIVSVLGYAAVNLALSFKTSRIITIVSAGIFGAFTGLMFLTHNSGFILKQWYAVMLLCDKIYYNEPIKTQALLSTAFFLIILGSIAAALIVYLLFNRFFKFFLITAGLISMQIFSWYVTGVESKPILAVICLLTVVSYFRHVYEKKSKNGLIPDRKVSGGIMLYSIPAAIIPVLLILSMPKNDLPIQWPWLDQKIMNIVYNIEQRFTRIDVEFFSLSSTGFNGFSERLGGPVRPSNAVAMDVKSEKRTYLRGASFNWYENNSWIPEKYEDTDMLSDENQMNVKEIQSWQSIPTDVIFPDLKGDDAVLLKTLASPDVESVLFPKYSLEVTYRNMITRSLFTPLFSILPVKNNDGSVLPAVEKTDGIMIADNKIQTGTKYKLDFVQPMYGDPMFKQALTYSSNNLYQDSLDALNNERNHNLPYIGVFYMSALKVYEGSESEVDKKAQINALAEKYGLKGSDFEKFKSWDDGIAALIKLNDRAKKIQAEYTILSDTIPERVKELSLKVTKDCRNNYEKLLAIQNYLSKNYTYTLNTSRVPQGEDFVDWFLFEDPKGYCTYFATAMTVMLRYNDIPARFVEGYVMAGDPDSNSVYTISNRYAHAWVEAYFEGFGWLTFDCTPIYSDMINYTANPDVITGPAGLPPGEYEAMLERYKHRSDIPGYVPTTEMETTNNYEPTTDYIKYLPYAIAGLILALILINFMAGAISDLVASRLKSKRKVIHYYRLMLRWLESSGFSIKPGETVHEYANRVEGLYYFTSHCFLETTGIYSKIRYGDKDVTPEEIIIVKSTVNELKKMILREFGIRRYVPLRRIIFGI